MYSAVNYYVLGLCYPRTKLRKPYPRFRHRFPVALLAPPPAPRPNPIDGWKTPVVNTGFRPEEIRDGFVMGSKLSGFLPSADYGADPTPSVYYPGSKQSGYNVDQSGSTTKDP